MWHIIVNNVEPVHFCNDEFEVHSFTCIIINLFKAQVDYI